MKLAEQGAIPASRAIDGLISGIGKRYEGLMDQQSRSLVGLISTTKDLAFGQRGLFGRFGEYAADSLKLQDRISGLNKGLENALSIVEEKGFGGLWDNLIPDGAEPAIAAVGGALTAIAGKGIYDAMVKLAPAIARVAIALGPVGIYGAAAGLALWGAKEAIDAIGADHPEIFGGVPQQKTSSTPESRDVTFGLAAPTNPVQAAAYANEQKAKNDALAKSNKALAAQGKNVYNAALPLLTGSGNTEPVGYGASNAPIDQFRRIEAGETATTAASSNYSLSPQMVDALVQNNRDLIQSSENLLERMAAAYKAAGIEGFASGGFTSGNDKTVAGVVHGGEYVMPAWMVDKYPELAATAEGIRTRGYAEGGPVGDIGGASKAMLRLTGIMRSASKEGKRGGDIFATDKATEAVGLYRLAGSSIVESLSKARSSGSDAMYNLGSAVANNSRLAKDSAVVNFGNIAAAAEELANKEPTVIKIIKLSDEELEAAKVSWPKTIDEIAAATIPNLQAWAEAMKITGASAGDGMATGQQKMQQSADAIKVSLGSIAIDAEGKMALFNLALTGAMAAAVAGMDKQGTMLDSMVTQVMDDMVFKATYAAAMWVVKNQDMENALASFKEKLAGMQEPVNNLPIGLKQAAQGGLEALNLLADQGNAAIWQVKGAVIDLMASVAKGTPAWAEFGNALIDVAEMAIANAEAQLIAAKAAAIAEAVMKAFSTGGASLLAIPGILLQAAAGMALLEGARALIPDPIEAPKAAAGGIVPARAGGTNVLVGEGGQPEAIIPLDRLDQYLQSAQPISGGRGNGNGITLQVVINNPVVRDDRDIDRLAEEVMEAAVRRLKREGVVVSG